MIVGLDRHYYPLVVSATDKISVDGVEVTLTPGTYYSHDETGAIATAYPSLYRHLTARLAAVIGGTWVVEPLRPTSYALRSSVRLRRTVGSSTNVNMSSTSILVQRVLGFSGTVTGNIAFVAGSLNGIFSAYGSWCPWSLFEGRAESKDSYMSRVTNWSSSHPEAAKAVIWRERRNRVLSYSFVFGSYVNQNRATIQSLATQAGMALNDQNNSFENLWTIHGRDLGNILVAYDQVDIDLKIELHQHEIVRFASQAMAQSMDSIASRAQLGMDAWGLKIAYIILGGNYGL